MVARIHILSLMLAAVAVFAIFYQMTNRPAKDDRAWLREVTCLGEYHHLKDGDEIHNYPDNPFVYRKGVRMYLRKKGVCEQ